MNVQKAALFVSWAILCADVCLSQRDCAGVDCPALQNCIETVSEKGACCTTCKQRGCTCEGYQYYDCVRAGFRKGKVPERESYFVDFGSTECSCPQGGGKIGCRFIPCPEIPPNCIDILQPADGCMQCGRIGCVHGSKKYEAGHSFQMEQCQVCHCPNEGGKLTCSPISGCDLRKVNNPTWVRKTENNNPSRDINGRHSGQQTRPVEPFPKLAAGKTLPLYKQDPPSFGTEDYDYTLAEPTSPTIPDLAQPLESTTVPPAHPESSSTSFSSHDDRRHEMREKQQNQNPARSSEEDEVTHNAGPTTAGAQTKKTPLLTTTSSAQTATTENHRLLQEISQTTSRHNSDGHRAVQDAVRDAAHAAHANKTGRHFSHHKRSDGHAANHDSSHSGTHRGHVEQKQTLGREEQASYPTVQFRPTHRAPVRMKEEGEQPLRQPQTLHNYQSQDVEGDARVSAKELVKTCCETGEKWASANGHCGDMEPPTKDRHSICWTSQQQCCLGSLRENRCLAGISAAREGRVCEEEASDNCGIDSFKECCGCCSLGLQFRREGHHCAAHHYLGFHCRHVFLNCCKAAAEEEEEEEELAGNQNGWHTVREKPTQDSSPPPKKVSDTPYPKEAFTIGEEREGENTVEGPVEVEDMDECLIYEGTICHHRCVNTPGSFRCECFPGYVLQDDAFTCAQEMMDEENRLKEEEEDDRGAAVESTSPPPPPSEATVPINPCEGNGPCEQQCTPVGGRPHCSCSTGFSLRTDGRSCEDVNECLSAHACQVDERCVNSAGSFICQRPIACPAGYHINNDICEDINECVHMSHNCGFGFECVNTEGSFRCNPTTRCPAGYTPDTQGNCIDIDECGALVQPCSTGFNCINTAGSYMCQRQIICSRGYHASPDGARCVDVDECQSNLHRCGEGQLCHNLPGSYRCECQTGYQYDSFRRTCADINECWRYPSRLCAQTCENTLGSYQCSCTPGFRLSSDGKTCEDVNECLANPCGQECANVYGSYQCYCRQGYYLREDGHTCDDIDECTQSIGHLCTYKCVNAPGSYQCECPESGYTMSPNGRSCRDMDECTTGAHNCSLAETCYNIQGSYRCLSLSCPPNYRKVSDTRCERITCPNYLECQNSPLRITYYYLSFQSNIIIPAQIFRIGPSPAYSGDNVIVSVTHGNEENYFSTRKLNAYTGAVYLQRQVERPRDFLLNVEMKLWRQGTFTTFQARIYVFITANSL
ncbi:fibulin-2-like isoform X1 [Solea senegalensis]|uniref:Fibulin-2-like isoform X1 n=1 Tax=Solea senegalensis TaxID=28829 RepID=A0AAV6SUU3_SOLSE|nr:fibulin-2-like [Solea senegalensis]KAG7520242.1 fibulin-2-like isoform X1 [Solea senegalensis]